MAVVKEGSAGGSAKVEDSEAVAGWEGVAGAVEVAGWNEVGWEAARVAEARIASSTAGSAHSNRRRMDSSYTVRLGHRHPRVHHLHEA